MDESEEYKEMCKALPEEIVKNFEKVIGSINEIGSVAVLDNGEVGYVGTHITGWQVHGYECSGEDVPVTRLYTQNQLQELIIKYRRKMYSLYIDWTDMDLMGDILHDAGIECYNSFEQCYLNELMIDVFDKIWNNDEWMYNGI